MDLIVVSLDRAARFAKKIAGYLQIQLPFPIQNDENGLSVGNVNSSFKFNSIETLFDMNKKQMLSFSVGLSNLILDILKILKHVKPEHDLDNIKLMDLLQIDRSTGFTQNGSSSTFNNDNTSGVNPFQQNGNITLNNTFQSAANSFQSGFTGFKQAAVDDEPTKLDSLHETIITLFRNDSFTLGNVPDIPPPLELC